MATTDWTESTTVSSDWSENAAIEATTLYDDPTLTYDDLSTYYDGFNPALAIPSRTDWTESTP